MDYHDGWMERASERVLFFCQVPLELGIERAGWKQAGRRLIATLHYLRHCQAFAQNDHDVSFTKGNKCLEYSFLCVHVHVHCYMMGISSSVFMLCA